MVEVILTGSPRTGTTAITELLCHDDRVYITNEANTYNTTEADWPRLVEASYNADNSVLKRWMDRKGFSMQDMIEGGPRGWLKRQASRGYAVYGDKTPTYVYDIKRILHENPGVKLVLTVRDCRDVVCSSLGARKTAGDGALHWMHDSIRDAAAMWTRAVRNIMHVLDWMDPADFILIKYEDSVLHPRATLRRLSELFGYDIKIANPSGGYRATNVGRWRQALPNVHQSLSPETLRCMEYFGYDWLALETSWTFSGMFEESGWQPLKGIEVKADNTLVVTAPKSVLQSPPVEVLLSNLEAVSLDLQIEPLSGDAPREVEFALIPMFGGHAHFSNQWRVPVRVAADGAWHQHRIEMPPGVGDNGEVLIRFALEFVNTRCNLRLRRVDLHVA